VQSEGKFYGAVFEEGYGDKIIKLCFQFLIFDIMEAKELISGSLNEQQLMMLRLLKNPMPEGDFIQIRRLAVKLLSKQLDETIEQWEARNNVTEESYEQLSKKHFRSPSAKS
jgi:hypothetical protein